MVRSPPSTLFTPTPRPRLPSLHAQAPQAPPPADKAPPLRYAQAPPLTHLRQLRARAGWGGVRERGRYWGRGGRGVGGPPLWPGRPSAGGVGVTEEVAMGPVPGPGRSAAAAAPSPSAASPEEGRAPPKSPPHHCRLPSPEQLPVPLPGDRRRGRTPNAPKPGRLLGKEGRRARGE